MAIALAGLSLIVFGAAPGHHVVALLQRPLYHRDPLVASMGREGDPHALPLSVFLAEFAGQPVTYLDVLS